MTGRRNLPRPSFVPWWERIKGQGGGQGSFGERRNAEEERQRAIENLRAEQWQVAEEMRMRRPKSKRPVEADTRKMNINLQQRIHAWKVAELVCEFFPRMIFPEGVSDEARFLFEQKQLAISKGGYPLEVNYQDPLFVPKDNINVSIGFLRNVKAIAREALAHPNKMGCDVEIAREFAKRLITFWDPVQRKLLKDYALENRQLLVAMEEKYAHKSLGIESDIQTFRGLPSTQPEPGVHVERRGSGNPLYDTPERKECSGFTGLLDELWTAVRQKNPVLEEGERPRPDRSREYAFLRSYSAFKKSLLM